MNPYDQLGVSQDATSEEIEKVWREYAKKHHPDAGGEPEAFAKGSTAIAVLRDPVKRKRYDDTGDIDSDVDYEAASLQMVQEALDQCLRLPEGSINFNTQNILDLALNRLRSAEEAFKSEIGSHDLIINRLESASRRTKNSSKKKNRITPMLDWQRGKVIKSREMTQQKLKVLQRAIEVIQDHTYEFDRYQNPYGTYFFSGGGGAT